MWKPSACDCECNEACKIDEYLEFKNCFFKAQLLQGMKFLQNESFAVSMLRSEVPEIIMPRKILFFSSTAKLKCCKIKFSTKTQT